MLTTGLEELLEKLAFGVGPSTAVHPEALHPAYAARAARRAAPAPAASSPIAAGPAPRQQAHDARVQAQALAGQTAARAPSGAIPLGTAAAQAAALGPHPTLAAARATYAPHARTPTSTSPQPMPKLTPTPEEAAWLNRDPRQRAHDEVNRLLATAERNLNTLSPGAAAAAHAAPRAGGGSAVLRWGAPAALALGAGAAFSGSDDDRYRNLVNAPIQYG